MKKDGKCIQFLGIGAEKCGTTWIADCIRQHPEIYLPQKKELFFFNSVDPHYLRIRNKRYDKGISWYCSHFKKSGKKYSGEFSPTYFYEELAAKRINKHFPDIKLILILRDPVNRAFSQYLHDKRIGAIKNISFEKAIKNYSNYIEKGKYYKYLKIFYKYFKRSQIKVIILDDVEENPKKVIRDLLKHIGVKDTKIKPKNLYRKSNSVTKAVLPNLNQLMISTEYKLRENNMVWMLKMIDVLKIREMAIFIRDKNSSKLKSYPKFKKGIRTRLYKIYKDDIKSLESLIGKDLSKWKVQYEK
jgi:hypothetical protein